MSLNTILATTPLTSTNYILKATGTTIGNSLIWDNGTNVGIGNTNTSYTLDVSGTLRNTTSAYFATTSGGVGMGTTNTTYATLNVKASSTQLYNGIAIYSTNGTESFFGIGNSGSVVGFDATYGASGAYLPIAFNVGGSERLRITTAGNVGIGTGSPSEQLSVMADNAYTSKIRFSYGSSATSYYTNFGYNSDGNKAYLQIADGGAAATIMTWNYNGNVGIGTSSPTGKLDVASRGITTGSMPVGSVIQTVHYQFGTAFSTSSASDIDTGLNLSITPTSSTSKILIIITAYVRATQSSGNCYIYSRLWRGAVGGTSLINGFAAMGNFASTDIRGVDATSYLDSPATTSAVTYRYSLSSIYAATVYLNSNTNPSTITLMEIAQ